ncbi:hypothetical protein E2C01_070392 [Portunus trituberculatus]|uniref:Uncharacterized protein n=1 Tax=Portunus trituberculatus TaxID=210409 RepID=A0A5B7HSK1_PORTR|nr:hypothetical protein [Portunus trituberculatus]
MPRTLTSSPGAELGAPLEDNKFSPLADLSQQQCIQPADCQPSFLLPLASVGVLPSGAHRRPRYTSPLASHSWRNTACKTLSPRLKFSSGLIGKSRRFFSAIPFKASAWEA